MIGECHYQMGEPTRSRNTPRRSSLSVPSRLDAANRFSAGSICSRTAKPSSRGARPAGRRRWGIITRGIRASRGSSTMRAVIALAACVAAPIYYPVYASEIVHCTALAISRAARADGAGVGIRSAHRPTGRERWPACRGRPITGRSAGCSWSWAWRMRRPTECRRRSRICKSRCWPAAIRPSADVRRAVGAGSNGL